MYWAYNTNKSTDLQPVKYNFCNKDQSLPTTRQSVARPIPRTDSGGYGLLWSAFAAAALAELQYLGQGAVGWTEWPLLLWSLYWCQLGQTVHGGSNFGPV